MGFVSFDTQLGINHMKMIVKLGIDQYMDIRTQTQRVTDASMHVRHG